MRMCEIRQLVDKLFCSTEFVALCMELAGMPLAKTRLSSTDNLARVLQVMLCISLFIAWCRRCADIWNEEALTSSGWWKCCLASTLVERGWDVTFAGCEELGFGGFRHFMLWEVWRCIRKVRYEWFAFLPPLTNTRSLLHLEGVVVHCEGSLWRVCVLL